MAAHHVRGAGMIRDEALSDDLLPLMRALWRIAARRAAEEGKLPPPPGNVSAWAVDIAHDDGSTRHVDGMRLPAEELKMAEQCVHCGCLREAEVQARGGA
jgi:hypothetical protein